MVQTAVFLGGQIPSVELAAIGRRVAETEWDLLLLIAPDATDRAVAAAARRDEQADDVDPVARAEGDLHGVTDLVDRLAEGVHDRLSVANPRYL